MKFVQLTITLLFLIVITPGQSLNAQTKQVRFAVNMEYANLEPGDRVVVRGNRAELGNWGDEGELILRPSPNNANIFGRRIRLNTNKEVLYKYVLIKADGTEIWEQRGNRILNKNGEKIAWFSDRETPGISQTFVNVTFRLDLTDHSMDGLPAEGVALMGAHEPLSFDLENGKTEMNEISPGVWEVTIAFPFGTPHDLPFKFAWNHDGEWVWEWRPGHTNHVLWLDDEASEQTAALRYDIELPGVVAANNNTSKVDDYRFVIQQLGDKGPQSRYGYELAMEQLRSGQRRQAEVTYARYKKGHPGGEEIDDFDYQMAYYIERNESAEAAERYVEQKLKKEMIKERRSYLRYLKGELALRNGNSTKARKLLREAMQTSEWEMASEYSRQALVASYMSESDPDSVQRGIQYLRRYLVKANPKERRKLAERLVHAYERLDMFEEQESVLNELATRGNTRQQAKGKLELAKYYMKHSRYSEALDLMDAIESAHELPDHIKRTVIRNRIRAYAHLEMHNEVVATFEHYTQKWPEDVYRKRLLRLQKQAIKNGGTQAIEQPGMKVTHSDSTQN